MTIVDKIYPQVIVFDDLKPEAAAMALAMYSRDPQSVQVHLNKVREVGPEKFMGTYYVGYGHKSIGDCGSTTICAEYVSMLAAKAIQDHRLYNGQEASTRYLDMASMPILNPIGTPEGEAIQSTWMTLYTRALEILVPYLRERYPITEGEKPGIYDKAIKAKAFDIARSFLPAGCTTFVGWHTNLRQAWDHLKDLLFHPLKEVRVVAEKMLLQVQAEYPSSFSHSETSEQIVYHKACSNSNYTELRFSAPFWCKNSIDVGEIKKSRVANLLLEVRPPKTELPEWFNRYGQIQFRFLLDFGSFRDIQRQRSCSQIMPWLTTEHGFHPWYLQSLPPNFLHSAQSIIQEQSYRISRHVPDPLLKQYYIAMGYQVACEVTAGLPSAVYIAELRSGQTVHPTLRPIAQKMGLALKEILPEMALYVDHNPDEWSTKRGTHDIVKKSEG